MVSIGINFLYKYFGTAVIVYAVGMLTAALVKKWGADRTVIIKETILSAMLWAENAYGIGNGSVKFQAAWEKIKELLAVQGVTLKAEETSTVKTIMESNIPKINQITYSALPDEVKQERTVINRTPEVTAMVEELRKKISDQPPVEVKP